MDSELLKLRMHEILFIYAIKLAYLSHENDICISL